MRKSLLKRITLIVLILVALAAASSFVVVQSVNELASYSGVVMSL